MIKIGTYSKGHDGTDFLLYPVLAVSYANATDKKAWALSVCFGFWGVYVAIVKRKK